jgi:tetratricopeptide (TPR) repeat protein
MGIFLLNLAATILFCIPLIVFREFGHALFGSLSGFKITSINIGSGRKLFETSLFKTPINFNQIPNTGLTTGYPRTTLNLKTRCWSFYFGGLFSSIFLLLLCFLVLGNETFSNVVYPRSFLAGFSPVTDFIYANIFIFILNAFPKELHGTFNGYYSDGYYLLTIPFMKIDLRWYAISPHFDGEEAAKLFAEEKFDEAKQLYTALSVQLPENLIIKSYIALVETVQGNLSEATRIHKDILNIIENNYADDSSFIPYKNLIYNNIAWGNIIFDDKNLLNEADEYSKRAFDYFPDYPYYLGTRGAVLIRLGEIDEGISLLEKALELHSGDLEKSADSLFIAIGEAKKGNKEKSLEWLETARKIHSTHYFFDIAEKEIHEINSEMHPS